MFHEVLVFENKNIFFLLKIEKIQHKNWGKKLSKLVSGYSKIKKQTKTKQTKMAWTTKSLLGGGADLSGPTTKKTLFYVCLPYHKPANIKDKNSFYIFF